MEKTIKKIEERELFRREDRVFHKKYGMGVVQGSFYGYLFRVKWENGDITKHTAKTLKLILQKEI